MRIYTSFLVLFGFLAFATSVPVTDVVVESPVKASEQLPEPVAAVAVEETGSVKDVKEQEVFAEAEEILEKIKEIKDAVIGSSLRKTVDDVSIVVNIENTTEKPTVVKVDEPKEEKSEVEVETEKKEVLKTEDNKATEDVVETVKSAVVATDGEVKTFRTPKEVSKAKRRRKSNKNGRNNNKGRRSNKKNKKRKIVHYVEPEPVQEEHFVPKHYDDDVDDTEAYINSLEGDQVDFEVQAGEGLEAYGGEEEGPEPEDNQYGQYAQFAQYAQLAAGGGQSPFGFGQSPFGGFGQSPFGSYGQNPYGSPFPMPYNFFGQNSFPQYERSAPGAEEMRRAANSQYVYQPTNEYEALRLSLARKLRAYGYL